MLPDCVILETPAATVWCDPLIPESVRKSIAKDPHRFIRSAAAMPVKISRETLVLQMELPLDGTVLPVAVKQYRPHTVWKAAAAMVRRPKAVQNWTKAQFLARGTSRRHGRCWHVRSRLGVVWQQLPRYSMGCRRRKFAPVRLATCQTAAGRAIARRRGVRRLARPPCGTHARDRVRIATLKRPTW